MAEIIDKRFPRIVTTDSQNNSNLESGGGKQLYEHNIYMRLSYYGNSAIICLNIINSSSDTFTETTLKTYLYENGITSAEKARTVSGADIRNLNDEWVYSNIYAIYSSDGTIFSVQLLSLDGTTQALPYIQYEAGIFVDTVIEL